MKIEWTEGFTIRVRIDHGAAVISANREGLLSLAKQMTALAMETENGHIHYDEYNSLEEGSAEMIIERIPRDGTFASSLPEAVKDEEIKNRE